MKTEVVAGIGVRQQRSRSATIKRAAKLLTAGEVVALPTETVYGLAADALRPDAAVKIFEAKERPRFDPLVVHIPNVSWLQKLTEINTANRELVSRLANAFWPGPLTIILPKTSMVPDIVTAGLDTVAVRISAHPIFREIIAAFGSPLAAPSANRFGRISPTTAQHVLNELEGRIPLVVDGGPTTHGVESTIIAIENRKIEILRPGPITAEDLRGKGFHVIRPDADRGIGFQPMDPREVISIRQGAYLSHWTQSGGTYAVTFRLADALPAAVVAQWKRDILVNARRQGRKSSDVENQRLTKLLSQKVETYLDGGNGKCWLRDDRVAMVVRDALLHFDGVRYQLTAWCIMPNHVHVIVRPISPFTLPEILHMWKSFTAQKANQALGREGAFWQPESYDHLIRNEQDLVNQIQYVQGNPSKAGLSDWLWLNCTSSLQPMDHRQDADATHPRAPGQLPSHYAPETRLKLINDARSFLPAVGQRTGLLAWKRVEPSENFTVVRHLSKRQDLQEAAANLFRYLRELDEANLDLIIAEAVPNEGLGIAINDRLRRATGSGGPPNRHGD